MKSEYGPVVKRREAALRPTKGFVVENNFDSGSCCWRRSVVSNVRENDTSLVVSFKHEQFYKANQESHDFYSGDYHNEADRKCAFCGEPFLHNKFTQKCPSPHTRTHNSSHTTAKFLVVGGLGPRVGSRLTQEEAGDDYVVYNRSTGFREAAVPKAVLIPKSALKG